MAEEVYDCLIGYSPVVEIGPPASEASLVYVDACGCGDEVSWGEQVLAGVRSTCPLPVGLGLAGSRLAARLAARAAEGGCRVVTEGDRPFLAPLPVGWLPLDKDARYRLGLLGMGTIGQFAALRETQVVEQFGPDALPIHRWARGLDDRPLLGRRQEIVQAGCDLEVAEDRHEALLETALRLARRALLDLPPPRDSWAIRRVELGFVVEGCMQRRSAWLGDAPTSHSLRAALRGLIENIRGSGAGAGVQALNVRLVGLEPIAGRQLSLFVHSEARRRWEQALQQLAKKHTPACVNVVDVLDAEAALACERYQLREYSEPLLA